MWVGVVILRYFILTSYIDTSLMRPRVLAGLQSLLESSHCKPHMYDEMVVDEHTGCSPGLEARTHR